MGLDPSRAEPLTGSADPQTAANDPPGFHPPLPSPFGRRPLGSRPVQRLDLPLAETKSAPAAGALSRRGSHPAASFATADPPSRTVASAFAAGRFAARSDTTRTPGWRATRAHGPPGPASGARAASWRATPARLQVQLGPAAPSLD